MTGGFFLIESTSDDGDMVLRMAGELDRASMHRISDTVLSCHDSQRVVVDTTDLEFIDSSGLAALVSVRNELGRERFVLVPGPATLRLLDLTGTREHLLGSDG